MAHVTQTETDLMKRLEAIQNKDWSVDVMTFAGFMDTREDLEKYVEQKEGK